MSERMVFQLSGIDWDDDESVRAATQRIWKTVVTRMGGTVPQIEQPRRPVVVLTDRVTEAVGYPTVLHANQARKRTTIPYAYHLLGVAGLVLEAGGDEDQAIAGLLHDAAGDHGGEPRLTEIKTRFGPRIESIVRACSDSLPTDPDQKAPWLERKRAHLAGLKTADPDVILVTTADKLHNARALVTDVLIDGPGALDRFTAPPEATVAFYREILKVLTERQAPPLLLRPLELAVSGLGAAIAAVHSYPGFRSPIQINRPAKAMQFAPDSPRYPLH